MYKIIIFDIDETLFDFKETEKGAIEKIVTGLGLDYDSSYHFPLYKKINSKLWKDLEKGLIAGEELKYKRFEEFFNAIDHSANIENVSHSFLQHLAHDAYLFDDSLPLLDYLKDKYRLSIITNGLKFVQDIKIDKSDIRGYFEDIVISEEAGVSKPDSKIFDIALSNLNHNEKHNVLMIGDSLSSDISGGFGFGIDTCWYNPEGKVNTSDVKPTYEINSLKELFDIL